MWKTAKPIRLRSNIAFTAPFMGKKRLYTYGILEFSETTFVIRTAEGPCPMETTYQFEKIDEHTTKMNLRNCDNPTGFSKLFAPFMTMMMRKENSKDVNK
jgi:hypothetical protein